MAAGREDALELALAAIRTRLREGAFLPGSRIPASGLAAALRLSATPVREALSRLAGEGLVEERRNQGFFVRTLTGADVADLYRMALAQFLIVAGRDRGRTAPRPDGEAVAADPIRAVEEMFLARMAAAGSRALAQLHLTTSTQLGPIRRVEPMVFEDLAAEAGDLLAATDDSAEFTQAVRRFHGRRIQAAEKLSSALNLRQKI